MIHKSVTSVSADISPCGTYRYALTRSWDATLRTVSWVMLNPSTADETQDDPTIRKCIGFAQRLGFGSMIVVNLYAFRATDPKSLVMYRARGTDVCGPDNDEYIRRAASTTAVTIVAWGACRVAQHRAHETIKILQAVSATHRHSGVHLHVLRCLGTNVDGSPRHPLMLPYSTPLEDFRYVL